MASKPLHPERQAVQQGVENIDYIGIVRNRHDAMMIRGEEDKVEDREVEFEKFVPLG
jgi:hypothetical protein